MMMVVVHGYLLVCYVIAEGHNESKKDNYTVGQHDDGGCWLTY